MSNNNMFGVATNPWSGLNQNSFTSDTSLLQGQIASLQHELSIQYKRNEQLEAKIIELDSKLKHKKAFVKNPSIRFVVDHTVKSFDHVMKRRETLVKQVREYMKEYKQYQGLEHHVSALAVGPHKLEDTNYLMNLDQVLSKAIESRNTARVYLLEKASKISEEYSSVEQSVKCLERLKCGYIPLDQKFLNIIKSLTEAVAPIVSIAKRLQNDKNVTDEIYKQLAVYFRIQRELKELTIQLRREQLQQQELVEQGFSQFELGTGVSDLEAQIVSLKRQSEKEKQIATEKSQGVCNEIEVKLIIHEKSIASSNTILRSLPIYVERTIEHDYENLLTVESEEAPNRTIFAHLKGTTEKVALKEMPWSAQALNRVKNELRLMRDISHPSIQPIRAVFLSNSKLYAEQPMLPIGNYLNWLKKSQVNDQKSSTLMTENTKRAVCEIKNMLRQVAVGLSFLHSQNIVHRNLKPSNILIFKDCQPILSDFGVSGKENEKLRVDVGLASKLASSTRYIAPETIRDNSVYSRASDMYSFGVLIYDSFVNYKEQHSISVSHLKKEVNDGHLIELVESLLDEKPSKRYTIHDCMSHPYFTDTERAVNQQGKIDQLRYCAKLLSNYQNSRKKPISANRNKTVIPVVTSALMETSDFNLLFRRWKVVFEGENGVDHGGLSSDLVSLFADQIFHATTSLFERNENNYLPVDTVVSNPTVFEAFGRLLLRSLVLKTPMNLQLSSFCYRWLLGYLPKTYQEWIHETESFDAQFASSMRYLSRCSDIQLILPHETFVNSQNVEVVVNDSNIQEYVIAKCQEKLYGPNKQRLKYMDLMKKGFNFRDPDLTPFFDHLTHVDLQVLLVGEIFIDATMVQRIVQDHLIQQQFREYFCKALQSLTQEELRLFLRWSTGLPSLISDGRKICLQPSNRFFAHTCSWSLEIPTNLTHLSEEQFLKEFQSSVLNGSTASMLEY